MRQEVLRMERVSSQEQGVMQLDGFNLSILAGEIMGLLPLNNHGLTALLSLLQRNTPLRYGYVYYREEQVNTWRDSKQRRNRIGLIQSESCLVEGLTVMDNIFVLRPEFKTWVVRPSILKKQLFPFLKNLGIDIATDAYVDELTAFEKKVVDILKPVVAGCKLIVLRDISSNISEEELQKIHRLLKYYADIGVSFLYIDFHIEELRQICDKVAFMSNGRIVKTMVCSDIGPDSGIAMQQLYVPPPVESSRSPVFEARGVSGGLVADLSFSVAPGECVVLQNEDIQVLDEFLSILSGDTVPVKGEILIDGRPAAPCIGESIAIIQEIPTESMLFNELSYMDNLCFMLDRRLPEIWRDQGVRDGVRREYAALLGDGVFDERIESLSQLQKYELVYTRIAIQKPKAVFCVQPFRRADMGLRTHILELIKRLTDKGVAVVILAVNLSDSQFSANRLISVRKGGEMG
jgi:ribose transport system ATP-binding protein